MAEQKNPRVLRIIPLLLIMALFCLQVRARTVQWSVSEGGNGHVYEVVLVPGGITWVDANSMAEQKGGHLATITSQDENDFVFGLINDGQYWNGSGGPFLGGYQLPGSVEPDEGWAWVTGEPFVYSNWRFDQPNNLGNENCIHFGWGSGITPTWNDLPDIYTANSTPIAYVVEFSKRIIYVDDNAAVAGDGTSWTDAYVCLQDALAAARIGDEIRVAQGIYKPDERVVTTPRAGLQLVASGDRTATFQLINGVTIKGGYAGLSGSDPNARNIDQYETILSGDIRGNDESNFHNNLENSYHIVTSNQTDTTAIIDGFTITGGNADNYPTYAYGGGILCLTSSPKITNNNITGNSAVDGGGIYCERNSSPTITNNIINQNISTPGYGGGICCKDNCSPIIINNIISGNIGTDDGGGICCKDNCNPVIMYNSITGNSAGEGGGFSIKDNCSPIIQNNTIARNSANHGSGIFCITNSSPIVINTILWNNRPEEIYFPENDPPNTITISYSNVQYGYQSIFTNNNGTINWLEGNIDTDPLFADPDNGDFHLKSEMGRWDPNSETWIKDEITSPCIDSGDPNSDFSGETWPHGGRINMGAYGGTREASMSLETGVMSLPQVAYIYHEDVKSAKDYQSLLNTYGCSTTLIPSHEVATTGFDAYDLIIAGTDTGYLTTWTNEQNVAATENSGKPIVGLGNGGYWYFGQLGLSIGNPYGGYSRKTSIEVVDPNYSLYRTPYVIDIPEDGALQLYSETQHIGIYLWPTIPETVTVLGRQVDDVGYFPLVMQHNRYILWGFTESPQKMTDVGKTLFINVIIWTANKAWESED